MKMRLMFAAAFVLATAGCRHDGVEDAMQGEETTDFSDLNPDTIPRGWDDAPVDPGIVPPPPPATDTVR